MTYQAPDIVNQPGDTVPFSMCLNHRSKDVPFFPANYQVTAVMKSSKTRYFNILINNNTYDVEVPAVYSPDRRQKNIKLHE